MIKTIVKVLEEMPFDVLEDELSHGTIQVLTKINNIVSNELISRLKKTGMTATEIICFLNDAGKSLNRPLKVKIKGEVNLFNVIDVVVKEDTQYLVINKN